MQRKVEGAETDDVSTKSLSEMTDIDFADVSFQEQKRGEDKIAPSTTNSCRDDVPTENSKELAFLKLSRGAVLIVLLLLASGAGIASFIHISLSENKSFDYKVENFSCEIMEASLRRADELLSVLGTLAVTLSSHAKENKNTSWPLEIFPNFELVVSKYREVMGSQIIATAPVVTTNERSAWEEYSVQNQGWINASYQAKGFSFEPLRIQSEIFNIENGHATKAQDGPFKPLWQISPPPRNPGVVNYNLLSNQEVAYAFETSQQTKQALLTKIADISFILDSEVDDHKSLLIYPILENSTSYGPQVVGSVLASLSWESFFTDLVRESNQGMLCVLRNSCGDEFTWILDGPVVSFTGEGDHHENNYDKYEVVFNLSPFSNLAGKEHCDFEISIYPTLNIEEEEKTIEPIFVAVSIIGLFLVLATAVIVYDVIVQRRQRKVLEDAARSNEIISSLFPHEIRDRLFMGEDIKTITGKNAGVVESQEARPSEDLQQHLKSYLNESKDSHPDAKGDMEKRPSKIQETKPIADLFPSTTVMFADIAGFTAWSSVREPSQVFTLLETVFNAFDKMAKRRNVFKIETVGDCYVAVTGLPEPLQDHAVVMCKFARECLTQFNILVRKLEVVLGPDTGDLAIRVGLHSGPVTAGVLRGDKSRFQLFGDTVNTAARVESTGVRNRIHLSHECAEFLHQAGKSSWLRKRNETVMAKGKGEMQTYWLLTDEEIASGTINEDTTKAAPLPIMKANAPRLANTAADVLDPEATLPPRIRRLVDWNVDVLKRLLEQIVVRRHAMQKQNMDPNHPIMMKTEVNIGCDTYVLDEVTEIIRLPGYTQLKSTETPQKIELPQPVEAQLRLYVSSIASMHRENSFHNFEHASHVMMSVSKLLSRIVAPHEVLKGEDTIDQVALTLHDHTYGITSDPLTQFSVVLAALIHDVDHSGVSNFQLIKEKAKIASVFKNKSVLEQNSIVLAWDRLMESRFSILRSYIYADPDELKRFRQLMVNTVLATDIFDRELQTLRKNRWDTAFRHISQRVDSSPEDDVNRKATIVIEHLIQASDVAHTMQHWHIYQKWNERLFVEMTAAYQAGRMDKDPADNWYQGELGFFDNYVIPLAKKLKECGVFGVSSDEYLNYALENRREWASKGEEVVQKMIHKYSKKGDARPEKKNEEDSV